MSQTDHPPLAGGRRRRRLLPWLLALGALALALACWAARRYGPDGARTRRLARAAKALVQELPERADSATVAAGGHVVVVPLGLRLDRERGVLLALESERLRRQAVAALQSAARGEPSAELAEQKAFEVAGLSLFVRGRLAEYLKVEPERARLIAHALGWPWLGESAAELPLADLVSPSGVWPSPLSNLPGATRAELVRVAMAAPAWPAAEQTLRERFRLPPTQTSALRAYLCRRAVTRAFSRWGGLKAAPDALAKYADLAPAQAGAVLAMAASIELFRGGGEALPFLEAVSTDSPELAEALHRAIGGEDRAPPAEE